MSTLEILSVHVPKCAGSSLRRALLEAYGTEQVYLDYDDRPIDPSSPINLDPEGFYERAAKAGCGFLAGKKAVHGHFNIRKYSGFPARHRITFLREPIDRTISHYFFWKDQPRHGHLLHDYVLDNRLSFQEFARLPAIRGLYVSVFFLGVAMEQFDFIGFYDRLDDDYAALQALIGLQCPIRRDNVNEGSDYRDERESILGDSRLMATLRDSLKDDLLFYERLRAKRS